jgi:hypothetical protein
VPEELAKDAIAHEESAPGDKVRMTFRVVLSRVRAETLAARAIGKSCACSWPRIHRSPSGAL